MVNDTKTEVYKRIGVTGTIRDNGGMHKLPICKIHMMSIIMTVMTTMMMKNKYKKKLISVLSNCACVHLQQLAVHFTDKIIFLEFHQCTFIHSMT